MVVSILQTILICLALIGLYLGFRFLGNRSWIMGWLRGMIGIAFLVFSTISVLVVLDLTTYRRLLEDTPIITISLEQLDKQKYKATLLDVLEGTEEVYELQGDQWQVDAKVIRWKGLLAAFGGRPSYRLDRIAGRYYSLEEELRKERTVYSLEKSEYGLDLWSVANQSGNKIPGFDAIYGSATYLPMADGALYEISLSNSGLIAKPLNAPAQQAVDRWR